jgi:2-polyprenyl-3-methyl-5-hydroxy-6-metoxy-1,4-benzoquinol methylase
MERKKEESQAPSFANGAHRTDVEFYNTSQTYLSILEQRNESDYRTILDVIQSYGHGGTVLDYGCGVGLLSMLLAKNGFIVTGVDISEQFIRTAKRKFGEASSITFEVIGGPPLRYADGEFDVIASSAVLEHCTGVDAILLEFKRLLKTNGLLVIETPNMLSPLARLKLIADRLAGRRKTFHRYGTPAFLLVGAYYLMKKIVFRKADFIYVKPDYHTFAEADEDVAYLSNPLDYLFFLRHQGFEMLELSRNTGFIRSFISTYLPYIAGGVMIAARKK